MCQSMIFKHDLDEVEEIEIEYTDGSKYKFSFDDVQFDSSDEDKEDVLLDWLSGLDWDEVNELEVEYYNGQKFEIDFGEAQDDDEDDEEDDEDDYDEDDDQDDDNDDEEDDY